MLLDDEAVHRRVRHAELHRLPVIAVVERHVQPALRAKVQEAAPNRVLSNYVRVAHDAVRDAGDDQLPRLSEILRAIDPRIAVVLLVPVDDDVGRARVVLRRLDVADGSPGQDARDVRRHVRPRLARVARHLHEAIVRARPDHARLCARLGDRVHDVAVFHADVVRRQAAGALLLRLVVSREVGADHAPASSTVFRHVHELAARVDRVVVVRGDRERRVPHEAILDFGGGMPAGAQRPHLDVLARARALVESHDDAAAAAGSGRRRPNEIRIDGIGRRPPALAALHRVPLAAGDRAAGPAVARPAVRWAVLFVAVHVIRNPVVHRGVIDLRDGQVHVEPGAAARRRDVHAGVIADDHARRIRRIDPDVVVVAARRRECGRRWRAASSLRCWRSAASSASASPAATRLCERGSAVHRMVERRAEEIRLVRIVRRDGHARVVRLSAREVAVEADHVPVHAAVFGAPQLAVVRGAPVKRVAVARLDQRVNAVGVRAGDRESDFSDLVRRQAVSLELRPVVAAVVRDVDAAPRAAALATPRVELELPHRGEQRLRISRVHHDVDGACVRVDEEHLAPRLAAVRRAIDAALLLRAVAVTLRRDEHDVGVRRVDDDAARCGSPSRGRSGSTCVRRPSTCRVRCRSRCGSGSTVRRCPPTRYSGSTAPRRASRRKKWTGCRRSATSGCRRRPSSRCRRTPRRRSRRSRRR